MSYKIAGKTDTFCQMNLFFFPFDQQMCFLEFTSWTYSESQLKFRELAKSLDVEKFAENEQWSLVRTEVMCGWCGWIKLDEVMCGWCGWMRLCVVGVIG